MIFVRSFYDNILTTLSYSYYVRILFFLSVVFDQ